MSLIEKVSVYIDKVGVHMLVLREEMLATFENSARFTNTLLSQSGCRCDDNLEQIESVVGSPLTS